jgi:hypothetical protein
VETVKHYATQLFKKMQARNRLERLWQPSRCPSQRTMPAFDVVAQKSHTALQREAPFRRRFEAIAPFCPKTCNPRRPSYGLTAETKAIAFSFFGSTLQSFLIRGAAWNAR